MGSDIFDEREKAFENKFKHDEELRFKAHTRAAKLFGLWVADKLGMAGRDSEAYAERTLEFDVQDANVGDIVRRVQRDMTSKGIEMNERLLHNQFNAKLEQARRQLFS